MSPVTHVGKSPLPWNIPLASNASRLTVSFKFNPDATAEQRAGLYKALMGLKDSCKRDGKPYILVCHLPCSTCGPLINGRTTRRASKADGKSPRNRFTTTCRSASSSSLHQLMIWTTTLPRMRRIRRSSTIGRCLSGGSLRELSFLISRRGGPVPSSR